MSISSSQRQTKLASCTRGNPCPVCSGHQRCSIGADGLLCCHEKQGEQAGFVCLGPAKKDNSFTLYRSADDPVLAQRAEAYKLIQSNGNGVDWAKMAAGYRAAMPPERRDELGALLGLPPFVIDSLSIGWDAAAECWTIPEVDGGGRVIGIGLRRPDGSKLQKTGGRRGLLVPRGWEDGDGPLLLPEGASNTLALTALGLAAIGRPSNLAGVDHLARALASNPSDGRDIIVVGDFDPKPSGDWPGLRGCKGVAAQLAHRLQRRVSWVLPPAGCKDVREWTTGQGLALDCMDSWHEAGERLVNDLLKRCGEPDSQESDTKEAEPALPRFSFRSSEEFLSGDYRPEWLIKRLLVAGQPAVIGGPKKSLKTTLIVDLAYSLATGAPFLGRFELGKLRRVGIMSGESGEYTLKETAERIAESKGVDPRCPNVLWEFALPRLACPEDLDSLRCAVTDAGLNVLLIDPLYLCLLSGTGAAGLSAANLYQMGPLLLAASRTCLEVGCTPCLAHHFRQTRASPHDEPQLDDLAYAGIQEFARQWLLLGRRESYEPGSGLHKLWLSAGGSLGQSGLWAVDIDEGQLGDDFTGRQWQVSVETANEARQTAAEVNRRQQSEQRRLRESEEEQRVLSALLRLDEHNRGTTFTVLRNGCSLSSTRVSQAAARLIEAGRLREGEAEVTIGNGAKRLARVLWRVDLSGD